jgi:hypothetical protein
MICCCSTPFSVVPNPVPSFGHFTQAGVDHSWSVPKMRIGQVSKQTGVTVDAIRFYERSGLLAAPTRSEGGYRLYSSNDLATLQFIRSLQTLGFSLNEIREFVSLRTNDLRACSAQLKCPKGKKNGRCPLLTVFGKPEDNGAE